MTKTKLTVFCELITQGMKSKQHVRTNQLINKMNASKKPISGLKIRLANAKSAKTKQKPPLRTRSPTNVTRSMGKRRKRNAKQNGSPGSKTNLTVACSLVKKEQKSDTNGSLVTAKTRSVNKNRRIGMTMLFKSAFNETQVSRLFEVLS